MADAEAVAGSAAKFSADELLTTKLFAPPPTPHLVARPRLIQLLNDGLQQGRKLTLVAAPVGSGKTTLVSKWLATQPSPFAWLSLDSEDNDPIRFWTYCIAALQSIQPGIGGMALNLLHAPQPPPIERPLIDLINQIADLPARIVWALDDYHAIETREIHQSIVFLLEHMPPQLHLALITREDPPFPLARLRVGQQMSELRAADLRFTAAEITEFFDAAGSGLNLTEDDLALLNRRTEGWAAGLQLAALSLQNAADAPALIKDFAGDDRYVVDYLVGEVVERQPPHVQEFLVKTAFLNRLSAPLCDAVTGQDNSRECLLYLQRANLFLIPLDNRQEWYRYHQLFGDLLHYQLKERVGAEGLKQLHQRAAAWNARQGFTTGAIQHYLAGEAYSHAADLVDAVGLEAIVHGQQRKVREWLEALPNDVLRSRSRLCVLGAWALNLSGQAAAVEPRLRDAEQALPEAPPAQRDDIQGLIYFVRAYLARRQNDVRLSTEYLRTAAEMLSQENQAVRASVNLNLGFNYSLAGLFAQADEALQAARRDGQAAHAVYVTLIAMAIQANTYAAQGRLHQAARLHKETVSRGLSESGGRPFPPAGYAYAGLGQIAYEQNDLERAEQLLKQAAGLGELMGDWSMTRRGLLPLAWLRQMQGDSSAAHAIWRQALEVVQQAESARVEAHLRVHQARLWLAQAAMTGNPSALALAAEWGDAYVRSERDAASYPQAVAQQTLAWLRLMQGRADLALAALEPATAEAAAGGHTNNLIGMLALQGLAHAAQGDEEAALNALQQALMPAAPEGYVRTFVDYGPPMRALLQRAAKRGILADYVAALLASFPASAPRATLAEPLTDREASILRLMAAGLSHSEVGAELYLSVNTVKWYSTQIYRKLGVRRRAQAIERAQELGLA